MSNSIFLEENCLELLVKRNDRERFLQVLKTANEEYVLEHVERDETYLKGNPVCFKIHCPVRNFAMAYFHLGQMYRMHGFTNGINQD